MFDELNKLNIIKSNYILQMTIELDNKVFRASKSFYSSESIFDLLVIFDNLFKENFKKDSQRLKLVLTNTITKKSKTKYYDFLINDANIFLNEIKNMVLKSNFCVDTKDNKYKISISNCISKISDKKSLTVYSETSIERVSEITKKMLLDIVKKEKDNFLVFSEVKKNCSSHRVLIYSDKITKGFSIDLPNYSSSEIINLFINRLREIKNEK